ncbi:E3 ubiquitin-protein ligase Mdm2-like isoform X2 [Zootermopsis nevadensis]|uniref:E3 ubiquitin-protein ligase Mdm2-like isoform X2 n=1 Tax=Zootermopsis nevadensis TaxID=136037 RepID=UPI000B8E2A05|nr:E3 ubiquitin-protein ligase Mdm2-like isoform X2 [Zootermopsis nevadensis]
MSLKRSGAAAFDGQSVTGAKVPRFNFHIVLEEESEQPTDEDEESVHSIQAKATDYAKDTSDTSSHRDWTDEVTMDVEYEVKSLSEQENPLGDGSLSSDTDDVMCAAGMMVLCNDELSLCADSSEISDCQLTIDPEVPRGDYWACVQCKNRNNNPLFRYCEKCYKVRKNFFPPRPRRKKRKRKCSYSRNKLSSVRKSSTAPAVGLSDIPDEIVVRSGAVDIAGPSNVRVDSGLGSSLESSYQTESKCESDSQGLSGISSNGNSDLCMTCTTNPKNGIFVHGKIGHICCCYKCALKVWTQARRCPLCNCKVNNVLKAIVV